jgi:transcriptional regulator GlxA family with amidase domain
MADDAMKWAATAPRGGFRFGRPAMGAQHFVFLLVENHTHLTLACAIEPLRIANMIRGETLYSWSYASEDGVSAQASNGSVTLVQHTFRNLPKCDRLFVIPGLGMTEFITRPC